MLIMRKTKIKYPWTSLTTSKIRIFTMVFSIFNFLKYYMLLRQPYTLMEEEEEDVLINEGESESGWTGIGAKRLSGRRGFGAKRPGFLYFIQCACFTSVATKLQTRPHIWGKPISEHPEDQTRKWLHIEFV